MVGEVEKDEDEKKNGRGHKGLYTFKKNRIYTELLLAIVPGEDIERISGDRQRWCNWRVSKRRCMYRHIQYERLFFFPNPRPSPVDCSWFIAPFPPSPSPRPCPLCNKLVRFSLVSVLFCHKSGLRYDRVDKIKSVQPLMPQVKNTLSSSGQGLFSKKVKKERRIKGKKGSIVLANQSWAKKE